jgi:polyribonucleotide 5'-hydroxyl-kinase
MMAYLNCHFALNRLRGAGNGPRVMIVGPEDSGKTSLLKILAAYALKSDQNPILINLDPGEVGIHSLLFRDC